MKSPSRKLDYSNNHLKRYQVKSKFQASKNHGLQKPETVLELITAF